MKSTVLSFNQEVLYARQVVLEGCAFFRKVLRERWDGLAYLVEDLSCFNNANFNVIYGDVELLVVNRENYDIEPTSVIVEYYKWSAIEDILSGKDTPTIHMIRDSDYNYDLGELGENFSNVEFPLYNSELDPIIHTSKSHSVYFGNFVSNISATWRTKDNEIPTGFKDKKNFIKLIHQLEDKLKTFRNQLNPK